MPKRGIDFGDEPWLWNDVEAYREYVDDQGYRQEMTRSEAVRQLVAMGLGAADALDEHDGETPDSLRGRRAAVRDALRDALAE